MQEQTTLDEVKQSFEQWRATKLHQREPTPKELRAQVKAIAPYYSRHQIINALAITAEQMARFVPKDKAPDSLKIRHDAPSNAFIEVPVTKYLTPQPRSTSARVLTITRSDGLSWTLAEASQDVISESLLLFFRG